MNTRKYLTLSLTFVLLTNLQLHAQDPVVLWDNTIGGESYDYLKASAETADGGFILGGFSSSAPYYDITESVGGFDYWIVKLNASGEIEWVNTIGTTVDDYLTSVVPTTDGGYLVGGYTTGGISGDKTDAAIGFSDYWISKLNAIGDIVWQKTIGGTGDDKLFDILTLPGSGFILSGSSSSGISGNKTQACIGGNDYWLMKINAVGNIVWQYTIGGSGDDNLRETIRNSEGNFVMAGYSNSGISGNKSEASLGSYDYWVIAINDAGTVTWQNTIGGSSLDYLNGICELNIGGYILAGSSISNISGDKSENSENYSDYCWGCEYYTAGDGEDYWIIRIDNNGDIIWENTYIASGEWSSADVADAFQYADNKIMIAGNSEGGFENLESDGGNDYWLLTIDTNGYVVRQQVLGGEITWDEDEYDWIVENGDNFLQSCFVTSDGGFFVAGSSNGNAGNDKTESDIGDVERSDYWVLKLGPDTCVSAPVYTDNDGDGEGGEFVANTCELTYGPWVSNNNDCNDLYASVNSSAIEICDNLDNDCNGSVDEGLADCNNGPNIAWDKTLGDVTYNELNDISATSDGGFIAIGSKSAVSPETNDDYYPDFNYDIELFKTDALGNIEWHKIITASNEDEGIRALEAADGGFFIGSTSNSGISGDKTLANYGYSDYWLIKLNASGDIEWQQVYGGSSSEYLTDMATTIDGGIVLSGYSYSDISGNKTENVNGNADYWVLKLNATGDIEWQNNIGGSSYDTDPQIGIDSTGNFYVGGQSYSGVSGDKTEYHYGNGDYWVMKLNAVGNIIWQNTIGGALLDELNAIVVDATGAMALAGTSYSLPSGDKSESSILYDYWVVKLTADGTLDWENTISGLSNDYCTAIALCPDGGYLVGGYTNSTPGADKLENYVIPMFNSYGIGYEEKNDFWIIKLDSLGELNWQNTIGGSFNDKLVSIIITNDAKITLGGISKSNRSADKTQDALGPIQEVIEIDEYSEDYNTEYYPNTDFWIVQLQPEDCTVIDELCNTFDDNCNGLIDDGIVETISITADGPTEFCQGGSVSLTATYSGTSLQWQKNGSNIPGATLATYSATTKGNYTCVTSSDCGTATSDAIFVNVFKNPKAIVAAAGPTTFCVGESVILNVTPVAGCSYQWYKDASSIPGATATNYLATTAGIYKCQVTNIITGCNKYSAGIVVTVPCKEGEEIGNHTGFSIYPNPANEVVNIQFNSYIYNNETIAVFDATGKKVLTSVVTDNQTQINICLLAQGMYFVRLVSSSESQIKSFIKQ